MQSTIKNIFKILGFAALLISPFWICRALLLMLNVELGIDSLTDYTFYSFRFDLKTLAIWYSPLFILLAVGLFVKKKWWHILTKILFAILYISALLLGLIAVFYYPISKSIVGIELFQLIKGQSVGILLGYWVEYWYVALAMVLWLLLVLRLYNRTRVVLSARKAMILTTLSMILIVFLARGGVALKPLNSLDAYSALSSKEAITALTPIYVLLESHDKQELNYDAYFSQQELESALTLDNKKFDSIQLNQPNVCLILLESFGKEYTGENLAEQPSYTPFLDSLATVSVNYTQAYANGLRSLDAVSSTLIGVPALMKQPYIGSLYTQSDIESVPEALSKLGYTSSFYHAADENSMGFKPFLRAQGLDKYVGKQQYPYKGDFDGTWGVYDEPFLQYYASELASFKQPWFSTVFTLSSHHPYAVPTKYNQLQEGTHQIHRSVRYTDLALREFFNSIKTEKWFKNTVFIITADHTSTNQTPEHQSYRGKYLVPLLMYAPSYFAPRQQSSLVQHIDISTTIKHIAGAPSDVSFGKSLLDSASRSIVHYDGSIYVCTNDSFTLEWNGASSVKLYKYKEDPKQLTDVSDSYVRETEEMLNELKMSIQKYNYRLLNNYFQ